MWLIQTKHVAATYLQSCTAGKGPDENVGEEKNVWEKREVRLGGKQI